VYDKYLEWARDMHLKLPVTQITFNRAIMKIFEFDTERVRSGSGRRWVYKNVKRKIGSDDDVAGINIQDELPF